MKKKAIKLNEGILNQRIQNRADEIISQGYEFGQIEPDATWERCLEGGPYSDMYTAAEQLAEEYNIDIETALNYLKMAFEQYEPIYEAKHKLTNKNIIKLNESQLKKIVAESVKNVLLENSFYSSNPFETSDTEVNLKKAIHELKETVNILETFCKDGMNEKHLLKMAQAYGERGMRLLGMAVSSAR